jgi:diguanylate cyclase (GGDEF)-like protein
MMTGGLAQRSLSRLADARDTAAHGQLVEKALKDVLIQLLDAETGQRGFLLSDRAFYLRSYYAGVTQLGDSRAALAVAFAHEPAANVQLGVLDKAIEAKLQELDRTVDLRAEGHAGDAMELVLSNAGQQSMDSARGALNELSAAQLKRTRASEAGSDEDIRFNYRLLGTALSLSAFMLCGLVWRSRQTTTHAIARNTELSRMLDVSVERTNHVRGLSELNRFLQSCVDLEEAQRLLEHQLAPLMRAQTGALYIFAASHDQLRQSFAWGDYTYADHFAPTECWAVRLNQPYQQPESVNAIACAHLQLTAASPHRSTQCLPLVAHGELMGLVVLNIGTASNERDRSGSVDNAGYRREVLDQVGLALGNLKLRELLRQQSILDLLTGLYNRRFLEESAKRELLRAVREQAQGDYGGLAVLMIDIDHFKRCNDTYGHEVGDFVMREVARALQRATRGSDVAARYGGDEFTVVLVNIPGKQALERAEQLRANVERLELQSAATSIGPVTISIGLATFPTHGDNLQDLVSAADKALYAAKNAGRNRVVVAPQLPHSAGEIPPESSATARIVRPE